MARHECAPRQQGASLVAVIFAFHEGNQSRQRRHGQIVRLDKVAGNSGEIKLRWIQAFARTGDTCLVEPGNVGLAEVVGISIAQPLVIDDADVAAELEGVLALGPGNIVHQVMHRNGEAGGRCLAMQVIKSTEVNERRGLQAHAVNTFTDESITEVVDQVVAQDCRVADGDTLVVTLVGNVRRISGKLRTVVANSSNAVILQVPAHEQPMVAVLRQVIVQLQDVGIQFRGSSCRELVAAEIEAITHNIGVGKWILVEDLHNRRIGAGAQRAGTAGAEARSSTAVRVHTGNLLWRKPYDAARVRDVADEPITQIRAGHGPDNGRVLAQALPFVGAEEEQAVLLDGAAQGAAESVANQLAGNVRGALT